MYEAKWWTAGESPADNQSGVWERVGDASPEAGASTEEEPFIGEPSELKNPKSSEFKVVGYFPSWKPAELDKVRYDVLTHINYSFLIPTAEGGVRELDNPNTAKKLIDEAHKNGVRVLIAVGGWSYNEIPLEPTFVAATSSDEKIKQFGDAILKVCDEYGFDGVDMDWEHPRRDGNTSAQYEKLMVYLGEKLHAEGKLLTSAVLSGATPDGGVYYDAAAHTDKVLTTVDWINVMAYDGGDGDRHSSYEFAVNCVDYWRNKRSMPAEKVVLGVPFYARPSWASYEEILAANPDAYKSDKSTFKGMEACYNGYDTIKKKTRHAKQNAGGVMIWEIAQDTRDKEKSLMSAIAEGMK